MSEPPKFAEWLLRRLVGRRDADIVAGDLRETFDPRGGGRLWYWWQALSCMAVRFSLYRRSLPGIGTDFSRAVRRIRRNPGYAMTAMLCLALALGVNTTLFSFLDSLYFRRLPVPEADRIVQIRRQNAPFCSWQEYFAIRNDLHSVQAAAVLIFFDSMEVGRTNFDANVEGVSSNFGQVLHPGAALGSWFGPESESQAEPSVVISYRLWKTRFAGDPSVLGKQVRILDQDFRIGGVALPEFTSTLPPFMADVWVPLRPPAYPAHATLIARMPPGTTVAEVTAEMRVVSAVMRASDPGNEELASPVLVRPHVGFMSDSRNAFFGPIVTLLSAVSGMVLLIACVNVANLLLSRAAVRQREIAIRRSLGASRARLFRETLAEGLVLAGGGLAMGVFFGDWTGRALELLLPSLPMALYRGLHLGVDWQVMKFLTAAGVLCAVLFSLPPALANGRRALNPALKGDSVRNSRQREVYSIVQVALSLTLLIATGLLLRALDRVQHIDAGFAFDHRAYVFLSRPKREAFTQATAPLVSILIEQARELPGVEDATFAENVYPFAGARCAAAARESRQEHVYTNTVHPNYFEVMGIPIVRGRGFARTGSSADVPHVIVNQTLARTLWPNEDPIGKTIRFGGCREAGSTTGSIVAVARDAKYGSLDESPQPFYYLSDNEDPDVGSLALIIRTAGDPHQWIKPLIDLVRRGGGDLRFSESEALGDAVARSLWQVKWRASLLAALGLLAIVLAAIGVYGVVACSVAQRTREIGVRMALGAVPLDVQWLVLAHGLRITAIGIAVGLLLSAFTVRLLRGFLYGLSPFDPVAFAAASLAWIAIAIFASWYPARRATRVDPMTALNYE